MVCTKRCFFLALVVLLALATAVGPASQVSASRLRADFNGDHYADLAIGVPFRDVAPTIDGGRVHVLYGAATNGLSGSEIWDQFDISTQHPDSYDEFGKAMAAGDFNCDGYTDLAAGAPGEAVGGDAEAGAVNVLYGSAAGISSQDAQTWTQDATGTNAQAGDGYGSALASGDFDGDGCADLAIGVPYEDFGLEDVGVVEILYGTHSGLSTARLKVWIQGALSALLEDAEANDHFGLVLAAGDFNGDGRDDLAVGVPHEDVGTAVDAGSVQVIYGSASGLAAAGNQLWKQGSGLLGVPETQDYFGFALAAGDFDGNGRDDLAIGAPLETLEGAPDRTAAGVVHVLYGEPGGLSADFDQMWLQDYLSSSSSESNDHFGSALAAGDFNADGRDDLAVSAPNETLQSTVSVQAAGMVNVLYGSGSGLSGTGSQIWHQHYTAILDDIEPFDYFGWSLAAADFDGDGAQDLAIGVPFENAGDGTLDTGIVHVLYGSDAQGLTTTGNQIWEQINAEAEDKFGYALAAFPLATPEYRVFMPLAVKSLLR